MIPDGVKEIDDGAFCWCESLKSVNISDSVTKIGYCAFSSCKSLKSVNISNSVTEIGEEAFHRTPFGTKLKSEEASEVNKTTLQSLLSEDEITYDESYMGDQIESLFMEALNEVGVESEPSIQGGQGSDFLEDSHGNTAQVDYADECDTMQDYYFDSNSADDFKSKVKDWLDTLYWKDVEE